MENEFVCLNGKVAKNLYFFQGFFYIDLMIGIINQICKKIDGISLSGFPCKYALYQIY